MARNSSISNFRKDIFKFGPVKCAIMTALIFEAALFVAGPYLQGRTDFVILDFKKKAVAEKNIYTDVLIIGDSVALFDLDAKTFSSISGLKTYNLALMQTVPMAGFYFLLREYLKNNKPPKFIIFLFADNYWNRKIEEEFSQYGLFLGFYSLPYAWDIFLRPFPGTKNLFLRLLPMNIPSVTHRDVIRYTVRSFFTGRNLIGQHLEKNKSIRETLKANNWWYPLSGEYKPEEGINSQEQPSENFKLIPSASNIYYFKKILNYINSYNIKAVYMFNPSGTKDYPDKNIVNFIESFKDIDIIGKGEYLFKVNPNDIADKSGHLTAEGARRYTAYLVYKFSNRFK